MPPESEGFCSDCTVDPPLPVSPMSNMKSEGPPSGVSGYKGGVLIRLASCMNTISHVNEVLVLLFAVLHPDIDFMPFLTLIPSGEVRLVGICPFLAALIILPHKRSDLVILRRASAFQSGQRLESYSQMEGKLAHGGHG